GDKPPRDGALQCRKELVAPPGFGQTLIAPVRADLRAPIRLLAFGAVWLDGEQGCRRELSKPVENRERGRNDRVPAHVVVKGGGRSEERRVGKESRGRVAAEG